VLAVPVGAEFEEVVNLDANAPCGFDGSVVRLQLSQHRFAWRVSVFVQPCANVKGSGRGEERFGVLREAGLDEVVELLVHDQAHGAVQIVAEGHVHAGLHLVEDLGEVPGAGMVVTTLLKIGSGKIGW